MYVIDWEILLHTCVHIRMCVYIHEYTMYIHKKLKKIITAGYAQGYLLPLANFYIKYETAVLLEVLCFLVSMTNVWSLLPIFNCLCPIFTFVFAPCKFIGICEVTELTLGVFKLASEFGTRVCFWSSVHALCLCSHHRAASLYVRDFLYKTKQKDCTSSALDIGF